MLIQNATFSILFGLYYKLLYFWINFKTMEQEKSLSNEESLKIITQMIHTAQGSFQGVSFHFLLWGWVVAAANLAQYYLAQFTNYEHPYMVWLISIPAGIVSMIYGIRSKSKMTVVTYSGSLIKWIWMAFGICLIIVIFSQAFGPTIPAIILLITGFATFTSGLIIKFKPLIVGGSAFWIFAVIALSVDYSYSPLISAVAIIVGYLVPGYMLKKQHNA